MPNQKADKEFLIKLEQLVQENLGNESFGVSELAKELGMSRSNLHRKVNAITQASVSQYIRQARLKAAKELLQKTTNTVSEVGYKVGFSSTSYFIKCFHDFYGFPPGQVEEVEEVEEESSVPEEKSKKKPTVILASLVSALILAVVVTFIVIKGFNSEKYKEINSLAVLPIDNLTGDKNLDIVAAGMHSALITDLQRIGGLRVPGKTSSKAFINSNLSVREIASKLKVVAVIEAELMRYGDSIEIQFRLINVYPNENQRWVNKYAEEKGKLFDLYSRLTKNIAEDLKIELSSNEEKLLAETRTIHPDAEEAYLKAMNYWDRLGEEDLRKAMDWFKIANEKAPDWAEPYAGIALTWGGLSQMGFVSALEAQPIIEEYTQKAIALDPNSPFCHFKVAAGAVWQEWDWEKGEKEFKKAIELSPSNAKYRIYYAHLLMIIGRKNDALYQANLALELDPEDPLILGLYGTVARMYSMYDEAEIQLTKALSIDSTHHFASSSLITTYRHTKQYDRWFELWKKRYPLDSKTMAVLEETFNEKGYRATVEKMIEIEEKIYNEGGRVPEKRIGDKYAQLKDFEKALDYWEIAYEKHNPNVPYLSIYVRKIKSWKITQGILN